MKNVVKVGIVKPSFVQAYNMQSKPTPALIVLLLLVASLLIAGCTQTTTQTTTQPPSSPTASQKTVVQNTQTTQAVREQVTAVNVPVPQQIGQYAPNAGYKFVAYNVTILNIDVPQSSSNPNNFRLRDTEDNVYTLATATYDVSINGLENVNTQPGDQVSGIVVFEVPQNATLKSLNYRSNYQNTTIIL